MLVRDEKSIAQALFTCTQYHADHGAGLCLLQLGSTRKLWSEDHRSQCYKTIRGDIDFAVVNTLQCPHSTPGEIVEARIQISRLAHLMSLVMLAPVGEEWIAYARNDWVNEELYQANLLERPVLDPFHGKGIDERRLRSS